SRSLSSCYTSRSSARLHRRRSGQDRSRSKAEYLSGPERSPMRTRLALIISALVAANAFAVVPQFWRIRTTEDFLAGDIEGFAVTSRGELRPGPGLKKVGTFNDPFVLSH